jgi:hypothetical protein
MMLVSAGARARKILSPWSKAMPLPTRIARLFARRRLDRDLADEIAQHLDERSTT